MSKPARSPESHERAMVRCIARDLLRHPTHRPNWIHSMRMGKVTIDPERSPAMCLSDRVLLRLLRGPALAGELKELLGFRFHGYLRDLNRLLEGTRRHVVSERVDVVSRLGLALRTQRYSLVRED